jgi:hypothetical protein
MGLDLLLAKASVSGKVAKIQTSRTPERTDDGSELTLPKDGQGACSVRKFLTGKSGIVLFSPFSSTVKVVKILPVFFNNHT